VSKGMLGFHGCSENGEGRWGREKWQAPALLSRGRVKGNMNRIDLGHIFALQKSRGTQPLERKKKSKNTPLLKSPIKPPPPPPKQKPTPPATRSSSTTSPSRRAEKHYSRRGGVVGGVWGGWGGGGKFFPSNSSLSVASKPERGGGDEGAHRNEGDNLTLHFLVLKFGQLTRDRNARGQYCAKDE